MGTEITEVQWLALKWQRKLFCVCECMGVCISVYVCGGGGGYGCVCTEKVRNR